MSETELSTIKSQPLSIIERAIEKGIDADTMAKLVDLQERMQKSRAEAEFNEAMQAFQSECPTILTDKVGGAKDKFSYRYATLPHIVSVIKPVLKDHGLSFSFDSETTSNKMVTTCTVAHVAGHSRSHKIEFAIDGTAAMSSPQKSASALTYGRRYSLCAALGIVTADTDDDCQQIPTANEQPGRSANAPTVPPRELRVSPEAWAAMLEDWKRMMLAKKTEPTPKLFADFVTRLTDIPRDRAGKAEAWTKVELERCQTEIEMEISKCLPH